jgi:XisI protein
MDTAESDRQLIQAILKEYARIPYSYGDTQIQTIFDLENDHYVLMVVGWDGIRRDHGCLVHVDIIDGKFWIQRDGTEHGIARELLDSGVTKERIVLAFRSLDMRRMTDFAVA